MADAESPEGRELGLLPTAVGHRLLVARSADGAVRGMVPVGDAAALARDVGALQRSALAEA